MSEPGRSSERVPDGTDIDQLSQALSDSPYSANLYLQRARCYRGLLFPDLAAGDAYKAILLADEAQDESGEHHDEAEAEFASEDAEDEDVASKIAALSRSAYDVLAGSLVECGCLRSAYEQCLLGLRVHAGSETLEARRRSIVQIHNNNNNKRAEGTPPEPDAAVNVSDLPDAGLARREIYPWNTHEPDRYSASSLAYLNAELARVAPKCAARVSLLPLLSPSSDPSSAAAASDKNLSKQLGLFATADISPGEPVLRETSLLTANNRLRDPLCDACSGTLPVLRSSTGGDNQDEGEEESSFACPECGDDAVFCSAACRDAALEKYHPAVCGAAGADALARGEDVERRETADALYFLLVARAFALAQTQDLHPLDLPEVRFLWGEFFSAEQDPTTAAAGESKTLPFSFKYHVLYPIHVLEKMGLDVFALRERYDTWVVNTLFAKFRGVASGRVDPRTGRPEVCAVHPLWCLANHSCAPNVRWEWGGEIRFWARTDEERVRWGAEEEKEKDGEEGRRKGGVREGEEILNHYCDVELGVQDRREWAKGALGGLCMCPRCVWESGGR